MTSNYRPFLPVFFVLLFAMILSASLQAQSTDENSEADHDVIEHQELIKYEKSYALDNETVETPFGETLTGINRQSPDEVFLAINGADIDPGELKKAELQEPAEEPQYAGRLSYQGSFDDGSVSFEDDSGSSSDIGMSGGWCDF